MFANPRHCAGGILCVLGAMAQPFSYGGTYALVGAFPGVVHRLLAALRSLRVIEISWLPICVSIASSSASNQGASTGRARTRVRQALGLSPRRPATVQFARCRPLERHRLHTFGVTFHTVD